MIELSSLFILIFFLLFFQNKNKKQKEKIPFDILSKKNIKNSPYNL
jgi:hypothetical protein